MAFDVIPNGRYRYNCNGNEYEIIGSGLRRAVPVKVVRQPFIIDTETWLFQFSAQLANGVNVEWNVYVDSGLIWPYQFHYFGICGDLTAIETLEDFIFHCERD